MQNRRKVLTTGAAGYIAGRMLPAFRERYDLVLLDVRTTNRQGEEIPDIIVKIKNIFTFFSIFVIIVIL